MMSSFIKSLRLSLNNYLKIIEMLKMKTKPILVGLLFGVGLVLALKSWLLRIMFETTFLSHLANQIRRNIPQAR